MEWSFFVTEEALKQLQPNVEHNEASLLRAFDANRMAILAAAMKAYQRERKGSYEIASKGFLTLYRTYGDPFRLCPEDVYRKSQDVFALR